MIVEKPVFIPEVYKKNHYPYRMHLYSQVDFRFTGTGFSVFIVSLDSQGEERIIAEFEKMPTSMSVGDYFGFENERYKIKNITYTSLADILVTLEDARVIPEDIAEKVEVEKKKAMNFVQKWKSENFSFLSKIKIMWMYN